MSDLCLELRAQMDKLRLGRGAVNVDLGDHRGLGLSDIEGDSGPCGPSRDATPARGLLYSQEPKYVHCADCDRPIGGVTVDVEIRPRTRDDASELTDGEHGVWCRHCERLTVYRVRA